LRPMRRLQPWMGTLITALLASGLYAGPAAATISSDGIAGVHVGMNEGTVRDTLGRPSSATGREGRGTKRLDYRTRKMDVLLHGDTVIRVRTRSLAQKTPSGVGPGTTKRAMLRKLTGERCATARGARVCWVYDGLTVLTFTCRHGRVTLAEVARAEG
jgi:hypothetical protein